MAAAIASSRPSAATTAGRSMRGGSRDRTRVLRSSVATQSSSGWTATWRALAGERQIVLVTGDPGIGKTTVVEAFLERVAARGGFGLREASASSSTGPESPSCRCWRARTSLSRVRGDQLVSLLREHAPSWLLQLPGLISAADREALHRQHAGVTRARMLREMIVGIEALTTRTPIIVVLEDLHWSDPSTLDLLVALARRRAAARLLVVGTYRPLEASTGDGHLLDAVKTILQDPDACVELVLDPLTEAATEEYLRKRFGRSRSRRALHAPCTGGRVATPCSSRTSRLASRPGPRFERGSRRGDVLR
jgi:hypothetical protein